MTTQYMPTLLEVLKKTEAISAADLKRAQEIQKESGRKLIHIIVDEQMISERELIYKLSSILGMPALNLLSYKPDSEIIKLIPRKIAERHEVIPISRIGKTLTLAMADPLDDDALVDIKQITNCTIRGVISSSRDIKVAIETFYTQGVKLEEVLADLDPESVTVVNAAKLSDDADVSYSSDEAPVIRMVNLIIQEAIKTRASDIHFEPFGDRLRIRFRVDGILQDAYAPPRTMVNPIVARLKIISELDITEKRLPQDGRFKAKLDEREIDFRVSVLPTYHGEKIVLRILDRSTIKSGLEYLGFSKVCASQFEEAIRKPYGIVLVTGPTGSGKSTTLYSILSQLNTKERNIMTIEDPIEYQIHGITQTQVRADIGLNFSDGLRSILRQSPDVILVGEIRDAETADTSVKAALTGHLVFSTLHTNNAAGAITRLMDMGVEPFLIASSLVASTAQRLIRRICSDCKEQAQIPSQVFDRLPFQPEWLTKAEGYYGKGCKRCKNKGYRGRLGVMEILIVSEEVKQMVIDRHATSEIEACARKQGMKLLFENAMEAFRKGLTTLEEVLRVSTYQE
jgi:type IV pilus assembly protein PilB